MTDYKEFAKQMRKNAVKNEQGNIICSPELWEVIASVIERAIIPPCKVGDVVYYINRSYHIELKKDTIYEAKVVRIVTTSLGTSLVIHIRGEWGCIQQSNIDCIETPDVKDFDRTVFLTKEEAEERLKELGK